MDRISYGQDAFLFLFIVVFGSENGCGGAAVNVGLRHFEGWMHLVDDGKLVEKQL